MARDAMLLHGLFCGMSDEEADALFAEGMALAEHLPVPTARIQLLNRMVARKNLTGRPDEALAAESCRRAEETGDPFLDFMTHMSMAMTMLNVGRLADAIAGFERCEAVCAGDPDYGSGITGFNIHGLLLSGHALCLVYQGRPTGALRLVERAVEVARERCDHEIAGVASGSGLIACEMLGDAPGALAYGRESMRSVEAGADGLRQFALTTLGRAHLMQGEWEIA
ncbi:MAG: hypothetical protein ACRERC_00745, partial [Candidatus Binatia bacterium]